MSREVRRVPLDFHWPMNEVWSGYLVPDQFSEDRCPDCENGYSHHANRLFDLWYGRARFTPETTGSAPLRTDTPAVRAFAERNVTGAPEYYIGESPRRSTSVRRFIRLRALIDHPGTDSAERDTAQAALDRLLAEDAIESEALRLADLWNGQWSHHLSQADVDALVAGDRLWEFTRRWSSENGWEKIDPKPTPTAAQVNEWSLLSFGHDALNASTVVRARCEREGADPICSTCEGHGSLEAYPGQRAEAEAWEPTKPPEGEGWQLWETVSEGSPVTPVFADAEGLVDYLSSPAYPRPLSRAQAAGLVEAGWVPSMVAVPGRGVVMGEELHGEPAPLALNAGDDR